MSAVLTSAMCTQKLPPFKGRQDPAIPLRIVHMAEVIAALMLADHLLRNRAARV
ncbi:hypothetical protein [Methanothrix sp.]|uniref:hypothetical protein n=1 Tax=Methanothrix sp. TaxID=90426 RepID=UPI003BB6418D